MGGIFVDDSVDNLDRMLSLRVCFALFSGDLVQGCRQQGGAPGEVHQQGYLRLSRC